MMISTRNSMQSLVGMLSQVGHLGGGRPAIASDRVSSKFQRIQSVALLYPQQVNCKEKKNSFKCLSYFVTETCKSVTQTKIEIHIYLYYYDVMNYVSF